MSSEELTPSSQGKFFEALYADPAVMDCSILASKIYSQAEILTHADASYKTPLNVATEQGVNRVKQSTRLVDLGLLPDGETPLVLSFTEDFKNLPERSLYAKVRGDLFVELARFALDKSGVCNYVQFPGEVSENQVYTPFEEAKRKPLLTSVLHYLSPKDVQLINFHESAESGRAQQASGQDEANQDFSLLYEYVLCPESELDDIDRQITQEWMDQFIDKLDHGQSLTLSYILAYAAELNRSGLADKVFFRGTPNRFKPPMPERDSLYVNYLRKAKQVVNPKYYSDGNLLRIHGITAFAEEARRLHADTIEARGVARPLSALFEAQFEAIFGQQYNESRESVMSNVLSAPNSLRKFVVKDAHESSTGILSNVLYRLTSVCDDNETCRLTLTSQIETMIDAEPTLSAQFFVKKSGTILQSKADGTAQEPDESTLLQLKEILDKGRVEILEGPKKPDNLFKKIGSKMIALQEKSDRKARERLVIRQNGA